jgi:hypothetical protein
VMKSFGSIHSSGALMIGNNALSLQVYYIVIRCSRFFEQGIRTSWLMGFEMPCPADWRRSVTSFECETYADWTREKYVHRVSWDEYFNFKSHLMLCISCTFLVSVWFLFPRLTNLSQMDQHARSR